MTAPAPQSGRAPCANPRCRHPKPLHKDGGACKAANCHGGPERGPCQAFVGEGARPELVIALSAALTRREQRLAEAARKHGLVIAAEQRRWDAERAIIEDQFDRARLAAEAGLDAGDPPGPLAGLDIPAGPTGDYELDGLVIAYRAGHLDGDGLELLAEELAERQGGVIRP